MFLCCRVPRPVTVESFDVRRTEPGSRDLAVRVAFARQGYVKVGP